MRHKPSIQESLDSILNTTKERKKRKEKETNKPAGAFGLRVAFGNNYPSPNLEWNKRKSQKAGIGSLHSENNSRLLVVHSKALMGEG